MSLKAFNVLWSYFIIKPTELDKDTYVARNESNYELKFYQYVCVQFLLY